MKSSLLTLLAVPAFFTTIFAAPAVDTVAVEKRQVADAYGIVETLYQDIQQYTGAINETTSSITLTSTLEERNAAAASNRENIDAITALITAAADEVDGLGGAAKMLFRRQTGATLAGLVSTLLIEISSTLNGIIGSLGLGSLLGSLNPLVSSLSRLILALRDVVDNLLELVQEILNGLLTGLSIGLAGLNLGFP